MRNSLMVALLGALVVAGPAQAQGKSCDQLRDEIGARIALPKDSYRLVIVPKDASGDGKTMGTCERGSRKVVFSNVVAPDAGAAAPTAAAPPVAPAESTLPEPATLLPAPAAEVTAPATDASPAVSPAPVRRPASRRGGPDEATLDQYKAWIAEARALHPYPDSEERMLQVMLCESGGHAGIVSANGRHHGLFQYMPQTWKGAWNTYREAQLSDARAQIFATALAWAKGKTGEWGCYKRRH